LVATEAFKAAVIMVGHQREPTRALLCPLT
jgi:hypothetical protein